MKNRLVLLALMVLATGVVAQDATAKKYGDAVKQSDLKEYLTILASDALEGRETGTRGQRMAAAFIASHFEELGLQPPVNGSYHQPVTLYASGTPEVGFNAGGVALTNEEYIYFGSGETSGLMELPLVFGGTGSDADLAQVDVKGKAVVIMMDAVASLRNNPAMGKLREREARLVILAMNSEDDFKTTAGQIRMFGGGRMNLKKGGASNNLGVFLITPAAAGKIFKSTPEKLRQAIEGKKLARVKPTTVAFTITPKHTEVKTSNVLGFLEGTDKKDEVIVITAHYDHIGKRASGEGDLINNGADDDGSGTVAVMALANAFVKAKNEGHGPRRSILFMLVTGEEKGLLGSQYYTDISPVYPLDKTVVNLNIDMVGRRDPQHKDSAPYVYVIGSDKLSTELHNLSEEVNKNTTKLIFDYTYNDQNHPERLYYRSDHWNFAKNDIPIIFYFDGIHEDYHQPSDEVDKIEFDLLTQRAQCVFYTAWEIANRDKRIAPDAK